VLKAGFQKCHRRLQHRLPLGCELLKSGGENNAGKTKDMPPSWVHHPPAVSV